MRIYSIVSFDGIRSFRHPVATVISPLQEREISLGVCAAAK